HEADDDAGISARDRMSELLEGARRAQVGHRAVHEDLPAAYPADEDAAPGSDQHVTAFHLGRAEPAQGPGAPRLSDAEPVADPDQQAVWHSHPRYSPPGG